MAGIKLNLKNVELKKHVGMIHSTNSLSLLERKIANVLLHNAYKDLGIKCEYEILISDLRQMIGYNSRDIKTIKSSLISLMSTVLEWNLLSASGNSKEEIWMASTMLADVKIEGQVCTYSYSKRMRELCNYPELYGRISLEYMTKFKSSYGLALYENCIRYQSIKQTPWISMEMFRKLMGVDEKLYNNIKDFRKRVIKKAVEEVNKHSPISVLDEYQKKNKQVVAIRFLISADSPLILSQDKHENNSVGKVLSNNFGLRKEAAQGLISKYGEGYVNSKIRVIEESKSYKDGKIENLARYLQKALEEDYKAPVSSATLINKKIGEREVLRKREVARQKMKQKYVKYQEKEIKRIYDMLNPEEQLEIKKEFSNYISSTLYYGTYLKDGMCNPLVWDRFLVFVRSSRSDMLKKSKSFEVFCQEVISEPS